MDEEKLGFKFNSFRGVASVAYEIGSVYLNTSDKTTKISRDFLKSPIQFTFKKVAQFLWVPIVICGILKVLSIIVTSCWNRYFPLIKDPTVKNPFDVFPDEMILEIFSYLNLQDLCVCRLVNKQWSNFTNTPILWKTAIYREIAFSSKNWAQCDSEIAEDIDILKEISTFPDNIVEELRRSYNAFPGKSIRQTHVLVRMPKGLTINKLANLAKKYFPLTDNGFLKILEPIIVELGDKCIENSVWLLMTRNVIQGSIDKNYKDQEAIVDVLAKKVQVPYRPPNTIEAITCMVAEYIRSKTRLFIGIRASHLVSGKKIFTRSQDNIQGMQVFVGDFVPGGFYIYYGPIFHRDASIGIAVLRTY